MDDIWQAKEKGDSVHIGKKMAVRSQSALPRHVS